MAEPPERQRRNLDITRRAFAAFSPDAFEGVLELADPDIEIFSSDELANSGSFRGREGFVAWVGPWLEAWEGLQMEVREMEPVGERHVVTSVRQSATGRGSGVPVEMDVGFLTEVRGDSLVALHLYATRDEAVKVAGEREL
jgi:ketosteroid isomerase-like protein